jgi:hypothetical protein
MGESHTPFLKIADYVFCLHQKASVSLSGLTVPTMLTVTPIKTLAAHSSESVLKSLHHINLEKALCGKNAGLNDLKEEFDMTNHITVIKLNNYPTNFQ